MRKLTYEGLAFYSRHGYKVRKLFGKLYLLRRYSTAHAKFSLWDLVILEDWK
jgi:hypothetical protein